MNKLGRFEIIETIGQGAMGVVYKARDPLIDRIVALKTLTTGLAEDPNLLKRFYFEARAAGNLQHSNIVTIYELGHDGHTPFIAMQFLNGQSLDKIIDRRPPLPLSQKIGFIVHVCRALDYAHKQKPPVVHRDIKPGNVMVTAEGSVLVVDFGIARLGEGTRSLSAGLLVGTLAYMSPQLFQNGAADARSDIWATGVMSYELLAYRKPFEGNNAAALMSKILFEIPPPLSEAAPGAPQDLQAVIDRMLAKDIEARYQSMEEVLVELEPIWQRLRQSEVPSLLENCRRLAEAGDLENAKTQANQILQIDSSNTDAKRFLEKLHDEFRRKQIFPQLQARVEKAQGLLAEGKAVEARFELEAALNLDANFLPAQRLLLQVQTAVGRATDIAEALHASKQAMAGGALTEAEVQLDKVLELDPGNPAALEQLNLIKEQRSRRARRKQRDELLQRARTLWTNLQHEECINLCLDATKQFPGDQEFSKLLEVARRDLAEQQRQTLLNEALNLIRGERFDDALRTLDLLLEQYPSHPVAQNLREHSLLGRERQIQTRRLADEKSKLQALVKEGKYEEVITETPQWLKEFPDDLELAELLSFARAEQSRLEQERRLADSLDRIEQARARGQFSEAALIAEKTLLQFPKNPELAALRDRARNEQKEKEKREVLNQRVRDIERLFDRQHASDAIDLARETLRTVGSDPRIADCLHKAEKQIEFRENRKRQQDETVVKARTLFEQGEIDDATALLNSARDTQVFPSDDVRVTQLLREIQSKRQPPPSPPEQQEQSLAAAAAASGPVVGGPSRLPSPPPPVQSEIGAPSPATSHARLPTLHGLPIPIPRPAPEEIFPPYTPDEPSPQEVPPPQLVLGLRKKHWALAAAALSIVMIGVGGYIFWPKSPKTVAPPPTAESTSPKEVPDYAGGGNPSSVVPAPPRKSDDSRMRQADAAFSQGINLFDGRQYLAAQSALEQALSLGPVNWPSRTQASDYLQRTRNRVQQQQHLQNANNYFNTMNYDAAKNEATQAANASDGDSSVAKEAEALIAKIPKVKPPPPPPEPAEPPKNYAPLIAEIKSDIGQCQWAEASEKLQELFSQPQYSGLLNEIESGRNKDNEFASRKREYGSQKTTWTENQLRTYRAYVDGVAGQTGCRRDEARNIVIDMDRELVRFQPPLPPPPPPPYQPPKQPPPPPPPVDHTKEVVSVVSRYAEALSKGSIELVKSVFNLTPPKEKELTETFKRLGGRGVPTQIKFCSTPQISGDSATVTCGVVSGDNNQEHSVTYVLTRTNENWRISSVK